MIYYSYMMDAKTDFQQKLTFLSALEKKVRRLLLANETDKAVEALEEVVEGYRSIGVREKARTLEEQLKNLKRELGMEVAEKAEELEKINDEQLDDPAKLLSFLGALEKKVKRRLLQGKTKEAIEDLKYIIDKLRQIQQFEKADLLETTLNQFIMELSGEVKVEVPVTQKVPPIKPIQLPKPFRPPPKPPLLTKTVSNTPSIVPFSQLTMPPPIPRPPVPKPTIPKPTIPKPPIPSTESISPSSTIKDQPLTDEEKVLKKLFDIKDMLAKKGE